MKQPIQITLINPGKRSERFVLYNKELDSFFDKLESKFTVSGANLIHLSDADEIISLLKKVLSKSSVDVLVITRKTIVLSKGPGGFVAEKVKFFSPYLGDCKKYTIKFLQ